MTDDTPSVLPAVTQNRAEIPEILKCAHEARGESEALRIREIVVATRGAVEDVRPAVIILDGAGFRPPKPWRWRFGDDHGRHGRSLA